MSDEQSAQLVPNFEQSLARLDEIARALEDNKLGLQESLGVYEEGVKLLRSCKAMLETAERQVELLTGFDAAGNPVTTAFDDTATIERSARGSASKAKDGPATNDAGSEKLSTESIDVSAGTTSSVKKPRKKSSMPKSPSSDASQLAPREESTDENSGNSEDSQSDNGGRLF